MAAQRLTSEARKSQIAHVAADLFARRGFNGVTTREIAAGAGVSEAILFRHFPTKQALFTGIIDQKIRLEPEVFDLEAAGDDDREVFRSVARWFLRQVTKDATFLRLMLYSALEDHALASLFLGRQTRVISDFLETYIRRRVKAGAFRRADPAVMIQAFVGMFFHHILMTRLFRIRRRMRISQEAAVEGFVQIFLSGVRT